MNNSNFTVTKEPPPIEEPTVYEALEVDDPEVVEELKCYGYTSAELQGTRIIVRRPERKFAPIPADTPISHLKKALCRADHEHMRRQEPTSDWTPEDGPIEVQQPFGLVTFQDGLPPEMLRGEISKSWSEVTEPLKTHTYEERMALPEPEYVLYTRQESWIRGQNDRGRIVIMWPDGSGGSVPKVQERMQGVEACSEYEHARQTLIKLFHEALAQKRSAQSEAIGEAKTAEASAEGEAE